MSTQPAVRGHSSADAPPTVLIIQETIKHYRLPFYDLLSSRLAGNGVQLRVAYSAPTALEASKGDNVDLPDTYGMKVPMYRPFGGKLLYQPLLRAIAEADLVVVEQANRYVLNHWLLLLAALRIRRVALWGHGWNHQGAKHSVGERYKRLTLGLADWWFAYTTGTAEYLQQCGYAGHRITAVQNAVDTRGFRDLVDRVTDAEKQAFRLRHGIASGARLGVFCGSLYPAKLLPLLLESARRVRGFEPTFELLIIGGGPDRAIVDEASRDCPWIHCIGPAFAETKAAAFALAELCLNPGLIGLGVLDAFAAGVPVFTTAVTTHSPEIEYLEDGINGRITASDVSAYAGAVCQAFDRPIELSQLRRGARASGSRYTLEAMVHNFHAGLMSCLSAAAEPGCLAPDGEP